MVKVKQDDLCGPLTEREYELTIEAVRTARRKVLYATGVGEPSSLYYELLNLAIKLLQQDRARLVPNDVKKL